MVLCQVFDVRHPLRRCVCCFHGLESAEQRKPVLEVRCKLSLVSWRRKDCMVLVEGVDTSDKLMNYDSREEGG